MKTVFINTQKDGIISSKKILVNSKFQIDSSFVDVSKFINKDDFGILIELKHNQTSTVLNLTETSPYVLIFFDNDLCFKGASYSIKNSSGNFTIQTQFKHILFLRLPHDLKLNEILSLKLTQ